MAKAAPRMTDMLAAGEAAVPDALGAVAAGGPIAELQRTLEQRLLAGAPVFAEAEEVDLAHRLSRLAGPAVLAAAYVGCALWLF